MIPQIIVIVLFVAFLIWALRGVDELEEIFVPFGIILIFAGLLYWGGFFDVFLK